MERLPENCSPWEGESTNGGEPITGGAAPQFAVLAKAFREPTLLSALTQIIPPKAEMDSRLRPFGPLRGSGSHLLCPQNRGRGKYNSILLGEMGFEEPEVLVEFARKLGEKIGGNEVAQVVGFLHGLTQRIGMMTYIVNQELQHGRAVRSGQVGFFQA